ncbi:MAG: hypothetical protein ACLFP1_03320 [Candidatus Goldiibacteriota bacterium]
MEKVNNRFEAIKYICSIPKLTYTEGHSEFYYIVNAKKMVYEYDIVESDLVKEIESDKDYINNSLVYTDRKRTDGGYFFRYEKGIYFIEVFKKETENDILYTQKYKSSNPNRVCAKFIFNEFFLSKDKSDELLEWLLEDFDFDSD